MGNILKELHVFISRIPIIESWIIKLRLKRTLHICLPRFAR